mmetsp:Transcript_24386/g.34963  ORF Transcript_24386/g.34963 Transcript_24386/m.34963 type:complete len:122 (+) Transcript_24386:704-1069(+)|eukprot:CAMPEP_0170122504 /NCGR_PEP_ID=MMETSP0020_2-20130122/16743_1 /TAXON_ID=98059 /ORGANISM="Dinobryon sp., Strain UTEXLB2267" /LENGTH=121 /DNA_ID=CAMNT_0010353503 /DNA_START=575 /DNA_END=940 /DNA_ORIENTATION=+
MLFEKGNDGSEDRKIPEDSVDCIELKAPFTHMFPSKAEAGRDQQIGETDCIISMKLFKPASSSSSMREISTCGALADMFGIVLVCQHHWCELNLLYNRNGNRFESVHQVPAFTLLEGRRGT